MTRNYDKSHMNEIRENYNVNNDTWQNKDKFFFNMRSYNFFFHRQALSRAVDI